MSKWWKAHRGSLRPTWLRAGAATHSVSASEITSSLVMAPLRKIYLRLLLVVWEVVLNMIFQQLLTHAHGVRKFSSTVWPALNVSSEGGCSFSQSCTGQNRCHHCLTEKGSRNLPQMRNQVEDNGKTFKIYAACFWTIGKYILGCCTLD